MRVTAWVSAAWAVVLAVAAPAAATQQYTIAAHDTLYGIARHFGVSVDLLAQVNGIRDPGRIRAGAVLVIPDSESGRRAPQAAPRPSGRPAPSRPSLAFTYVVRPGDTLYHLALAYGTTVEALQRVNGLASPQYIRAGQVLRIPGPPPDPHPATALAPLPVRLYKTAAPASEHRGPAPVPIHQARDLLIQRITGRAQEFVGTPYAWGGASRSGVDCSGLVYLLYSPYVPDLPRGSYGQFTVGQRVARADLQPGDLVFFTTYASGPSHVGIYLGDGRFVTAGARSVIVDELSAPYWAGRYIGARRLI
jgi:LysM repeat protein